MDGNKKNQGFNTMQESVNPKQADKYQNLINEYINIKRFKFFDDISDVKVMHEICFKIFCTHRNVYMILSSEYILLNSC